MRALDIISEEIRADFENKTALRDDALRDARQCIKHASLAIRAIHRNDEAEALRNSRWGRNWQSNCVKA